MDEFVVTIGGFPHAVQITASGQWEFRQLTPEEQRRQEEDISRRRMEQWMEQLRRRQEEKQRAEDKAKILFLSCLTAEQRKQFEEENRFKVTGSHRGRYIISCDSAVENVVKTRYGLPLVTYCAAPTGATIMFDIWLAQKLILESDEKAFLDVAVSSPYYY